MDDFSKIILNELVPRENEVSAPKKVRHEDEAALDHLAAPVLLERAAYLRKMAKLSEGTASEVLKQYPQHAIHLLVRSRDGGAEQHERFADLFLVLDGHAALATGGAIANARTIAPGEVRGDAVHGGARQELRAGDVAHVPAGLPHQMLVAGDRPVTCLVIKIEQSAESS